MPRVVDVPTRRIAQRDTVRLISSAYTRTRETVLHALDLPEEVIEDLAELDGATNERLEAEQGRRTGISIHELVFGVPEAVTINASFTHPKDGGRFHDQHRGAWYAGFDAETAAEEVRYHRLRALRCTRATGFYRFPFRAYLSDFAGEFHSLTLEDQEYLQPEPVPGCYAHPQALARTLLNQGSAGIVYPSVRRPGGWVIVCFRPALVFHVRAGEDIYLEISL